MRYRLHNRLGSGGFAIEAALTIADIPFDYEPLASDPITSLGALIQKQNKWPMCSLRCSTHGTKNKQTYHVAQL
ncbi:MAG: hypothetical protein ACRBBO_05605 [Cognatishimia sp.]